MKGLLTDSSLVNNLSNKSFSIISINSLVKKMGHGDIASVTPCSYLVDTHTTKLVVGEYVS